MKTVASIFLLLFLFSCSQQSGNWQKVEILDSTLCSGRKTECVTNHQGEHILNDCFVYVEEDVLYILFPAALPAYWLGVDLEVSNGVFKANVDGIPFKINEEVSYRVKTQQLELEKHSYAIGDTLKGYVNITFEEQNKLQNKAREFYFKGCIYKIVGTKEYCPFEDDDAVMSYDLELAINELGEPLNEDLFTTCCLPEFRVELLTIFPASDSIYIRELTWNTSSNAQVSDGGILRLTVWYAQQDSTWMPVRFLRWNTFMQL